MYNMYVTTHNINNNIKYGMYVYNYVFTCM